MDWKGQKSSADYLDLSSEVKKGFNLFYSLKYTWFEFDPANI